MSKRIQNKLRRGREVVLRVNSVASSEPLDISLDQDVEFDSASQLDSDSDPPSQSSYRPVDKIFQIVLIGERRVGKTSLAYRFAFKSFDVPPRDSFRADFWDRTLEIGDRLYKVILCDVPASTRRSTLPNFFRAADAVLLVFDSTNERSFAKLSFWLELARKHSDPRCMYFITGTKADKDPHVCYKKVEKFAEKEQMWAFSTSALTGAEVDNTFVSIVKTLEKQPVLDSNVRLEDPKSRFSSCCKCKCF